MSNAPREPITEDFLDITSIEKAEDLRDLFIRQMEAPFKDGERLYSEREPNAIGAFLTVAQILKALEKPQNERSKQELREVLTTSQRLKTNMARWAESITEGIGVKDPYVLQAIAEYVEPYRIENYPASEIALRREIVEALLEEFDGLVPGAKRIRATLSNGSIGYAVVNPAYTIDALLDDAKILSGYR